ncbi:hypothetical protein [Acinetobacter venetianus]|jgi:hypothetical protein|uniref:hypothetical protein n=1 Tax=Acinetobacter venetianus TaxID=52133 RepID=UPI002ABF54C9|nr:hypothetical protein [Acinetobacter venetianus]
MKIGYIGGVNNGKFFENFDGYESYKLNWHIQIEDIKKTLAKWNEDMTDDVLMGVVAKVYDSYNLLILNKNNEKKLFYVLDGMTKDEILEVLADHWCNADIIGYDCD